jgi:ABC-type transport system substrate-binding protein
MRSVKKYLIVAGILLVFAAVLIAAPVVLTAAEKDEEVTKFDWKGNTPDWWDWGDKYWSKSKPRRGGYFRSATNYYIGLMNPNHWPVNDWPAMVQLYNRLIVPDGTTLPTIPFMAESWEFVNPTTVVMKLRRGIKYTDGSTFNAEGVKYQMDWIKDKSNGAWSRAWIEELESTEVVDEYTVRFNLKSAWIGFEGNMASVPAFMISAKALKADKALIMFAKLTKKLKKEKKKLVKANKKVKAAKSGGGAKLTKAEGKVKKIQAKIDNFKADIEKYAPLAKGAKKLDTNPVGSGPYMLEEGKPGNYLKLKRNPDWWFGKAIDMPDMPYFDGRIYMVIPDQSIRLANFRAGKIHSLGIGGEQYDMVRNDKGYQIYRDPGNAWTGLKFNTSKGPCKDIRVRKAVTHALDVQLLHDGLGFGLGFRANGPFHYQHWANNPNLKPAEYDPELSKRILAEAGYKDGLVLKGHLPSTTTAVSVAMQSMLKKVGIDWQVDFVDDVAYNDRDKNLEYDLAGASYYFIFDPDLLITALYLSDGSFNYGRYSNPEVDRLTKAGRLEFDQEKRKKIYWELVRVLREDYADVWMTFPEYTTITHNVVHGYNAEYRWKGGDGYWFTHFSWFADGKGKVKYK